jgi:hypothetical protein
MNFVRYIQSRLRILVYSHLERCQKPHKISHEEFEARIAHYMSIPRCSIGEREIYIKKLQDIGELPLDKIMIDGSGKSIYRLTIRPSLLLCTFLIQITKDTHALTVLLKTVEGEMGSLEETISEEIINIDPSDSLFYERFRSLQENIDSHNFWLMPLKMANPLIACLDGVEYSIEVSHHDQYGWTSGGSARKDEDFEKLCLLFLNLPVYDGSILNGSMLESLVSHRKSPVTREYYPAWKVQSAQEIEEEIEAELQALKSKLID